VSGALSDKYMFDPVTYHSVAEIRVGFLLYCCLSRRLRWHCGCHQSTGGVSLVHQYKKVSMVSIVIYCMNSLVD